MLLFFRKEEEQLQTHHTHAWTVEHIAMLVPLVRGPIFLRIIATKDKNHKESCKTGEFSTHLRSTV